MKILFLSFNALPTRSAAGTRKVGGLNTIVFHLSKALAAISGNNVGVTACMTGDCRPEIEQPEKVEINRLIFGSSQTMVTDEVFAGHASLLLQHLSENPVDLIHASGSETGYILALARDVGLRIPWVHTNYATLAVRRVVVDGLSCSQALSDAEAQRELISLRRCERVVALSEVDMKEICQVFGIDENKVIVATPGVDRNVFFPEQERKRKTLVVAAGRMSKIKDFPFLIRSFRLLLDQNDSVAKKARLLIVGGNQEERQDLGLPTLVDSLNLGGQVSFVNGLSQTLLAEYFRKARVFVGSSLHETFGLLPVEARACGTPSIARANSSYIATVKADYGGCFVKSDSEIDMAKKIAAVLSLSEKEWRYLSDEAIDSVSQYTWPRMALACQEVYHSVLRRSFAS